jgi:RNA polymerase sigma factor (sigma-70 family)
MPTRSTTCVIEHLCRAVLLRDGAGLRDGELLGRFIDRRDEAAVTALVRRHGPMVWGVCRRLLSHHDAEDAFQATFLVLVRKAASIVPREMVGNWLYGVARQTALQARRTAARRKERERQVTEMPEPAVTEADLWRDLRPLLDEELGRLPDKYRAVIVLCDLEGQTRREAAGQLGVPEGTVAGWLARARVMLTKRLARHGLAVSGGTLAAVLSEEVARAGVPSSVAFATIRAASSFAGGQAVAGIVSVKVATLVEGVMKAMSITRFKTGFMLMVVVGVLGIGGGALAWRNGAIGIDPPDRHGQGTEEPGKPQPALEDPQVVEAIKAAGGEVSFWKEDRRRWTKVEFQDDKGNDASLVHLKGLRHLETLNLTCGPAALGGRQFTDAGLAHLKDVKTIRTVNFAQGQVSDAGLAHLKAWTALEALHFTDVPITGTGLEHLNGLPVKLLWVSTGAAVSRQFTDAGIAQVKGLPKLEDLSLLSPGITDAGLEHLHGMVHLRFLTLGTDGITDKGLVHLKPLANGKLEHLTLLCPAVTDAGLEHLTGMVNLKDLNLCSTRVTDDGLRKLAALTKLTALTLSGTGISDAGLAHLHGLSKLQHLDLTDTSVTEAGLEKLRKAIPGVKIVR